jgi:hypothetical protein
MVLHDIPRSYSKWRVGSKHRTLCMHLSQNYLPNFRFPHNVIKISSLLPSRGKIQP